MLLVQDLRSVEDHLQTDATGQPASPVSSGIVMMYLPLHGVCAYEVVYQPPVLLRRHMDRAINSTQGIL